MSDLIAQFQDRPEQFIYTILAIVAAIAGLTVLLHFWVKTATRRRIKKAIRQLGGQAIENITLPDGVDSTVQIDFLVFSHGRLLVLNIQDYPGMIFGGENIEQWTQMYESKSYKFLNPLHYNRMCIQAAKQRFPAVKVYGRVVFSHHGEFPKGIPEGVSRLDDLTQDMKTNIGSDSDHEAGLHVWQDFVQSLGNSRETRIYKMQSV